MAGDRLPFILILIRVKKSICLARTEGRRYQISESALGGYGVNVMCR